MDYDYDYEDVVVIFTGCTCDHKEVDHGWGSCDVKGCNCKGGWEE